MSDLAPRTRRGAHRARRRWPALVVPVLVGGLVAAGLAAAFDLGPPLDLGRPGGDAASARAAAVLSPAERAAPDPAVTRTPGRSAGGSGASAPAASTPADHRARTAVIVLNATRIPGLAAAVAADLSARGWTVTGTGNFRGEVGATTVYHPAGQQAAARALAADLGKNPRVRPRFANLSTSRLTVVATADSGRAGARTRSGAGGSAGTGGAG